MSKAYRVVITENAVKDLRKMDPTIRRTILRWINKNLEGCDDPRRFGKALTGDRSGEWSYRVGSYRILAEIIDETVIIEIFKVGNRGKVYRWV